jgi:hypothetical protein
MKIHQLLSGFDIAVTNAEQQFMERYDNNVKLASLDEHDQWLAQTLVRKGIYKISKDSTTLLKNLNETNN